METSRTKEQIIKIGSSLTGRHKDVLDLASRHRNQKQIASALGISENTVKTHATEIRWRYRVSTLRQAVALYEEYRRLKGLTPKGLPTSEAIATPSLSDPPSDDEVREHTDETVLDDPMDGSGERTEGSVRSGKESDGQRVGGENPDDRFQNSGQSPPRGSLLDRLAHRTAGSSTWIGRLSFPELVFTIFALAVCIILMTAAGLTSLLGSIQLVQDFSGQTG